ncbi:hypothetical protein BDF21DRAFT_479196 [Thamnidium elegans]|nr:hypothetical protein BDF21DRAFT_479196 [Thamnidium elegans]
MLNYVPIKFSTIMFITSLCCNIHFDIMSLPGSLLEGGIDINSAVLITPFFVIVERRNKDYKCVYLPPYSLELNPIEQF